MKVFRFMSNEEFQKYRAGEILKNTTNHHESTNSRTKSIGFCFLNAKEFKPEYAFHFLFGIVDFAICAVFEVDGKYLKRSYGRYAKPKTDGKMSFIANEYCTTEYSMDNFKLLKYTIPDWFNWNSWKWEVCTNELQVTKGHKISNGKRDKAV